jgi:BirA family biotin operon repressor/biotin-[acetyl-CoA-carboxylase] ligase
MLGIPHIRLDTVPSTNREARERIRAGAVEGTLITAEHQTEGRGRFDRRWEDNAGQSLLASYILFPVREPEEWGGLPLLAGLAVKRAADAFLSTAARLKWPNDVLVEGKKLSGILVESGRSGERGWAVVGIGVNVLQREFAGTFRTEATSLLRECGRLIDVDEVLAAVTRELSSLYARWTNEGNAWLRTEWKECSGMFPSDIELEDNAGKRRLRAVDLGADGSLVVENERGERASVFAGDVSLLSANEEKSE